MCGRKDEIATSLGGNGEPPVHMTARLPLPLVALGIAAFAVGTTEFAVAGLLPSIATDVGVSVPKAGLLVTAYAIGVAVGGPFLAIVTTALPRKPLLMAVMAVFVAGNVLCAVAPSFWLLVAARLLISFSHGLFFGVATVLATRLVREDRRSSAIAVVMGGVSLASLLGVPGGTAIGHAFGWRTSFGIIACLSLLAALILAATLPSTRKDLTQPAPSVGHELRVVRRHQVFLSYVMGAVTLIGDFALFTYIVPVLTEVTGVPSEAIPAMLLLFGLGGTLGTVIGGRLGDWKLLPVLTAIFALQTVTYLALVFAVRSTGLMYILVFIWGAVAFAFASPLQSRILKWSSDAPNFASTLISTTFNIGVAAGAWAGGIALATAWGYADLPWIGVVCAGVSLGLAMFSWAIERRTRRLSPGS
jgi:DHA1 family inner membrane transport protein